MAEQTQSTMMRGLVAEAMMKALSTEAREQLVSQAIEHVLMRPPKNNYGKETGPSPLEQAYQRAMLEEVQAFVKDHLATNPEIQAKLREAIMEALARLTVDKEEFTKGLCELLVKSLRGY